MKRAVFVVVALVQASISFAAPPTCFDALVRNPRRTYVCTVFAGFETEPAGPYQYALRFRANGQSANSFFLRLEHGATFGCGCDPRGSGKNSTLWTSNKFTCAGVSPVASGLAATGRVTGPDGATISDFKTFQFHGKDSAASVTFGNCALFTGNP